MLGRVVVVWINFFLQEPMEVDQTSTMAKAFSADMSVIKPSSSGHLTVSHGSSGSPIKAGMSTPTMGASQPRRSPRSGGMPPPGQTQVRKPWQSRKVGGLTPQPGTKPAKKTLKHSASTSVLPRQQQQQPLSFRWVSRSMSVSTC